MVFYGNYAEMIDTLKQKKVTFSFILENRFGERYQEDFDAVILILEHPQKDAGRLPHIIVETSNYKIGKYVNNTDGKQAVNWEDTTDG